MQQLEPQLEIASRLLSGIISQDRNRKLGDRADDIRHSLDVAAELIRQNDDRKPPELDLTLEPPTVRTREKVIEREEVSLRDLQASRRRNATPRASDLVKGPTLH